MILPAQWIKQYGENLISPFNPAHINPASYDITVAKEVISNSVKRFLPANIMPGEFMLATTEQYFRFPLDIAGDMRLKSTVGRLGLNHVLSVWFDPGFEGEATLELQNVSKKAIYLTPGTRIAQMIFMKLVEPTHLSYRETGRYFGQTGPTPARAERDDREYL